MLLLMSLRSKLHPTDLHPDAGLYIHPILCRALQIALPAEAGRSNNYVFKIWRPRRGSFLAQTIFSYAKCYTQSLQPPPLNLIHYLVII